MRPIVSFINSPLYNLSKYISKHYHRQLTRVNLPLKILISADFLKNANVESNECMILFDKVSLFINRILFNGRASEARPLQKRL